MLQCDKSWQWGTAEKGGGFEIRKTNLGPNPGSIIYKWSDCAQVTTLGLHVYGLRVRRTLRDGGMGSSSHSACLTEGLFCSKGTRDVC